MAKANSAMTAALTEMASAVSDIRYQPAGNLNKFCWSPNESGDFELEEWLVEYDSYCELLNLKSEMRAVVL